MCSSSRCGRSIFRCPTVRCCRPRFRRIRALFRSLGEPSLEDRLQQSVLVQRLLCRPVAASASPWRSRSISACAAKRSGARSFSIRWRCRSPSPARCGAGSTAPTPASNFSCAVLAGRFHLPPDDRPQSRDLRGDRHRRLAVFRASRWRLFLAGLRSVDPDLVKAAQIDGAGRSASIAR